MPRKYERVSNKRNWSLEKLNAAIAEVKSGRPIRAAGREYDIPESTLRDKLKLAVVTAPNLGRKTIFTTEQERELAEHIKKLSNMFFGVTPLHLRELVFSYAEKNNIIHNFNRQSRTAGKDWLKLFMRRNADISIRKPEGTSINRIQAFNEEEVARYFYNLEEILRKHNFEPNRIFNVDETGISTVQKPVKILSPKGQKQVGCAISWERGKNVTIVCAFSASGIYIPPMFIFPRQRHSPQLEKGGPLGAKFSCSKNGWINRDLFLEWIKHFQKHVRSSIQDKVLLILDNHVSHISLDIFEYCKDYGIIMVSLPPHTSHRLQPLDLTFYGPLKNAYNRECTNFLRANPHKKITHYELAELFNKAYMKTATLEKAQEGFKASGVVPFEPTKFNERDFAPAQHFGPVNQNANPIKTLQPNGAIDSSSSNLDYSRSGSSKELQQDVLEEAQPSTSKVEQPNQFKRKGPVQIISDVVVVPFSSIAPIPQPSTSTKPGNRKKHSEILTGTPMKDVLQENQIKRAAAIEKKEKNAQNKRQRTNSKLKVSKRSFKRKVRFDDSESDEDEIKDDDLCDDDELDDVEMTMDAGAEDEICLVCGEFGRNKELWYRCVFCGKWAHAECTSSNSAKTFVCDYCQP